MQHQFFVFVLITEQKKKHEGFFIFEKTGNNNQGYDWNVPEEKPFHTNYLQPDNEKEIRSDVSSIPRESCGHCQRREVARRPGASGWERACTLTTSLQTYLRQIQDWPGCSSESQRQFNLCATQSWYFGQSPGVIELSLTGFPEIEKKVKKGRAVFKYWIFWAIYVLEIEQFTYWRYSTRLWYWICLKRAILITFTA